TEEDPAKTLKAKIVKVAADIPADDTRLLTTVFDQLPESISWPEAGLREQGIMRIVNWRQSSRQVLVSFVTPGEEALLSDRIRRAVSGAAADFVFVISLGATDFKAEHTAVWEVSLFMEEKYASILREFLAARQIAADLRPSSPADAPLIEMAREAVERLKPAAELAALTVFYGGAFIDSRITVEPVVRHMRRFERLLEEAGEILLEDRYPGYREIAPRKIAPAPRLYQRLLEEFIAPGGISFSQARERGLSEAIEGLATPLGLGELRSGSYVFTPDPENHPLLVTVFGLIGTAGETRLEDVVRSLQTGRFGLPADTAYFLLAALAYGGLIALLKNGRALPLERLRLTSVQNADALAPGEVIGKHDRETLINECHFLAAEGGWESFGLRQQREAWQAVIKFREWTAKTVSDVARRLSAFAEFSAFEAFDLGALHKQLDALLSLSDEIKVSYPAREGLERFLKAWRSHHITAHQIEFIKKIKKFLTRQADQFVFVNHYIRHTAVDQAAINDQGVFELRTKVLWLLDHPDELVMGDDTRLPGAFDRFRAAYADYYIKKHDQHYQQFIKKPFSRFVQRAQVLLRRLASIEILDRPPGLEALLTELQAPKAVVCRRNLLEELIRSPICNCAFIPDVTLPPVHRQEPEAAIEQALEKYLLILKGPRVREAIAARNFALAEADPESAKRLHSLITLLADERSSASGLLDILDDITAEEISKALAGRVTIEKRGLKDLYACLGGRRLAADQVREIVTQWISAPAENTVIAIEDDQHGSSANRISALSWWTALHPALFKTDVRMEPRDMEAELERQFPALKLKDALKRLDDGGLTAFIKDEPFHTQAIRTAWLLLAERVLAKTPWPHPAAIESRHADREIAAKIKARLKVLHKIFILRKASFPDALRVRIPLSDILIDSWASEELRVLVFEKNDEIVQRGAEWLFSLPAVEPVVLNDHPIVLIVDGISPDVWLESLDALKDILGNGLLAWFRLETAPKTAPAVSALFGFSLDAMDEFAVRGIPYHHVKGNEERGMIDLLPPFPDGKPVVIRVSQIDEGAHAGLLRLAEIPAVLCRFFEKELPGLRAMCARQNRRLVITTDHGFSLTRKGLSHGTGGVFEQAIFRAEWGIE
ncbi:MAG: hypothetical protein KKH68_06335, partial [Proteobacteria bacterium]|nr:hypothetical protein [Pseudomonadota bacterium]